MDYSNSFFAGCESIMEDEIVNSEAEVAPEEEVQETNEVVEETQEAGETAAEVEQAEQQAEMAFRKFEEIDRMIAHVERYGVDRAFLSLCNHNNILGTSFGISLPATESYDAVGSPYSSESVAAMEGLRDVARKIWEFLKRMVARLGDWLVRIGKMYDVRKAWIRRKIKALEEKAKNLEKRKELKDAEVKVHDIDEYTKLNKVADKMANQVWKEDAEYGLEKEATKSTSTNLLLIRLDKDPTKYTEAAGKLLDSAEKLLKEVGKGRAEIAKLNTEIAAAERESKATNKDNVAKDLKVKVQGYIRSVKQCNGIIGDLISAAGKATADAGKIIENCYQEKGDKKSKK